MPNRRFLIAGVSALALLAIPALGQEKPESILPPGFGEPAPVTGPTPAPAPGAQPSPGPTPTDLLPGLEAAPADPLAAEEETAAEEEEEPEVSPYDLPDEARRPANHVGVLDADHDGLGEQAWAGAQGPFLSKVMRHIRAPIASRWGSILLRRALLSQTYAPEGVGGADWAAERAWLLLRMGEADSARMLVAGVDVDQYTPKLFQVAMQSALATADPAALCPLTEAAAGVSKERSWDLARAMCAALSGEPGTASALIDSARRRDGGRRTIDMLLAEKVVGAGGNGRRAITIQWTGVNQLTAWRFGLANATGAPVPPELLATVGPHVQAWQARAPMLESADRVAPAAWAAALGVLSNAAYVDLLGSIEDSTDPSESAGSVADRLRTAYVGEDEGARLSALRTLWTGPEAEHETFARLVLTARAATRIKPSSDYTSDARNLIAAMLSAGFDVAAERWSTIASDAASGADSWALLAVGAPGRAVDLSASRVGDYVSAQDASGRAKGQLLVAALAGLGRLSATDASQLASDNAIPLGLQNSWTRAIDLAARANQPGTVALLAAAGMQTRSWKAVPPAYLLHILSALRRVGREGEARMIAAEAITRA